MSERSILTVRDGKIVNTGKVRLPDGTIRVQPEGGIQFIPVDEDKKMKAGGAVRGMGAATKGGKFTRNG
tara:strand:+ start:1613 stop:1819 length:207 start_codon:yes stop_codon:yes gene_type:complete